MLEHAERISIAVAKIVELGLLQRGRERNGDGMVRKTSSLGNRGDRRRVCCLLEVENVTLRAHDNLA